MSSFNKKTKKLYAETRRKQNRLDQEQQLRADVEQELLQYFQEQELEQQDHIESFYPAIYQFIKCKAPSLVWKKYAHEFFRAYIKKLNSHRSNSLPLPSLTFEMKRDQPVFSMDWIEKGHQIDEIIDKLWDHWILVKDSQAFSDDEIIGNIIISAMLYSGLNQKASLDALLEHLKDPAKIRKIEDLNIIFLEPLSPSYGDLFIDEKTIRKSRNFIPDQITRLWLIHFNSRNIRAVNYKIEDYLALIFNKINLSFNLKTYKLLRDYANFNWMQLPRVDIDPALSQCLIENTATCGLSEIEFEKFLHPKFKYQQDILKDINLEKSSSVINPSYSDDIQQALNNVLTIHKDLLKLIRTHQTDQSIDVLIINYCTKNADKFNEYSKRIALWLISLYKPTQEKIQYLSEYWGFCIIQFQKTFQENQPLADSSIYTYYTRIAEPWLTHSLQYLDSEDDLNTILANIYQQIITNTRLANEVGQPEFKKSSGQTIRMLKRFHSFQQTVFEAGSFELESITIQNRPRARIIGPVTYQAFMNKLDKLHVDAYIKENEYRSLKIIYILAYRTGMRINEILGLRVRDIEGLTDLSIWIQPYGSKKLGNLHQLKTDSAERKLPVYCLLKPDEYQLFHSYVVEQRLPNQKNLYLFHNWNQNSKLNRHTVTTPFRMIMSGLFKDHDYSFHSFRHTAANHLALVLNCNYAPLVKNLTNYTEEEYQSIRAELLRNTHGQNHWFMIAHLLGHIDPTETFKSYIHLSYLIAGHKILQYHPNIDTELAKKMMGYSSSFKFLDSAKDSAAFNFEKYSTHLSQQLLNDQTDWLKSNVDNILSEISSDQTHDFFKYFAGTKESKVSFSWFYKCLNLLEIHHDPDQVSREMSLPVELVNYWYENAKQLGQLRSQKGNPRLFDLNKMNHLRSPLKPAMVDTIEEQATRNYFFENIQNVFEKNPNQIQAVLEIFLKRVTISHTGIHYRWKNIDQLELFYYSAKDLFPRQFWHLLGKNLIELLDAKKQPLLLQLAKLNTTDHPKATEDYIRLQLYSTSKGQALTAFKFCLHLACIGRPQSIQIK
ncbi:site-specific integrase [Acinetobacter sp. ANC 4635]|uniref:tyrosine-type recombinase/integrase n=1 Tax=Acinetobacter sp. ANC 4635 TaxID=2529846 RepID=UPI001039986C|nr:tyrosine-type recombinase/integrase [Acinetobacter sp. ANC 4635]TCB28470.1 site-specific integrase [Acinetobacter sp. ANC 4635]